MDTISIVIISLLSILLIVFIITTVMTQQKQKKQTPKHFDFEDLDLNLIQTDTLNITILVSSIPSEFTMQQVPDNLYYLTNHQYYALRIGITSSNDYVFIMFKYDGQIQIQTESIDNVIDYGNVSKLDDQIEMKALLNQYVGKTLTSLTTNITQCKLLVKSTGQQLKDTNLIDFINLLKVGKYNKDNDINSFYWIYHSCKNIQYYNDGSAKSYLKTDQESINNYYTITLYFDSDNKMALEVDQKYKDYTETYLDNGSDLRLYILKALLAII